MLQAARRAEKIAALDSKQNERVTAREARRTAREAVSMEAGETNTAKSTGEFWTIFTRDSNGAFHTFTCS